MPPFGPQSTCRSSASRVVPLAAAASAVKATSERLHDALFGEHAVAEALIAEWEGEPAAFALFFHNFSTWEGRKGLYLEDLYVSPEYRGGGAGKALLKHLARIAVDGGCGRFEWSVLDWNEPAIKFYESIGAKAKSEWVGYQLAGEALETFAKI